MRAGFFTMATLADQMLEIAAKIERGEKLAADDAVTLRFIANVLRQYRLPSGPTEER